MRRPFCLLCLFYVLAFVVILSLFPVKAVDKKLPQDGKKLEIVGKLYRIEHKKDKVLFYLSSAAVFSALSDDSSHPGQKYQCICYFSSDSDFSKAKLNNQTGNRVKLGNTIRISGTCRHFDAASNAGAFDAKQYYGTLGIDFFMTGCEYEIIDSHYDWYRQMLYRLRRHLSDCLQNALPKRYAGILQAMLLGEKGGVSDEVKELYQKNGISHILAISGLHISLLGMGLFRICKRVQLPLWLASGVSFFLLVSYGEMTGQGASTVRSIIMFSLFLLAGIWKRTYDMQTAMALSLVILLTANPYYLYQAGFLLSFGAVMGIALLVPFLQSFQKKVSCALNMVLNPGKRERLVLTVKSAFLSSFSASLAVFLATFPIQLSFFYTIPLYSVFLNPIVVALMGALMTTAVAGLMVSCVLPQAGWFLLQPCRWILQLYETLCVWMSYLPWQNPVLGKPAPWKVAVYYGAMLALIIADKKLDRIKNGRKTGMAILLFLLLLFVFSLRSATECTMLDVGQGDCFVITEKSGCNILVDGGSSDVEDMAEYRLVPYLKSRGIARLDYVFASHADLDHISGIMELLREKEKFGIRINCLILTKYAVEDGAYKELSAAADSAGCKLFLVAEGDCFSIGDTKWRCLYPSISDKQEGNDQSMVLLMECGGVKTLFMGDLTGKAEEELFLENIDILKVGHHGSRYSTTEGLLKQCTPQTALISAGRDNSYGHPHTETLERLQKTGAVIYQTPQSGAVTIRYGKGKYSVFSYKEM